MLLAVTLSYRGMGEQVGHLAGSVVEPFLLPLSQTKLFLQVALQYCGDELGLLVSLRTLILEYWRISLI